MFRLTGIGCPVKGPTARSLPLKGPRAYATNS